jgi:hypothetical protein
MSRPYLTRALSWLVGTTALYYVMNGAQIFETAVIVPVWTAAPPDSLGMFRGQYGLDFKTFWIILHSLHEITFILALALCWKLRQVRMWIIVLLVVHIALRMWTVAYFAPTIMEFQGLPPSSTVDPDLVSRAALWRQLNYLRVVLFMAVNIGLLIPILRTARLLGESTWSGSAP